MRTIRAVHLLELVPMLAVGLAACERGLPTAAGTRAAVQPRATYLTGYSDFEVCSNGADGSYTVALAGGAPGAPITVPNGTCQVVYHYPGLNQTPPDTLVTVTYLAAPGVVLDSIVKDSTHNTSNPAIVQHTVTTLYATNVVSSTVNNDAAARATFDFTVTPSSCGTLTIGFWKNHAGFGPQADAVTPLLPQWLGTSGGAKSVHVTTAAQAVTLLSMNGNASNPVNKLYAQLLAAKLNIASGADGSAVASVISAADAFLATHDNTSVLTKTEKQTVNGWASTLDSYNNGLIGPGHCGA